MAAYMVWSWLMFLPFHSHCILSIRSFILPLSTEVKAHPYEPLLRIYGSGQVEGVVSSNRSSSCNCCRGFLIFLTHYAVA